MISVTISGQPCWLITCAPNAEEMRAVQIKLALPVDAKRSLTGNSSRRPGAILPTYEITWTSEIDAAEYARMRNASLTAQDEPILAPLWPHAIRVGIDTATITAALVVAWTDDWATYAINPGSLAGYTYAAPLLYGRFTQPPRLRSTNDEFVSAQISVFEDSPVSLALAPSAGLLGADTTFATAAGWAAPVFPWIPDWNDSPTPGLAVTDVDRSSGGGRQKASAFYPQLPEQIYHASFRLTSAAEAAKMLAWWARRAGITDPHWVALSQKVGTLSAPVAAGAIALNFTKAIAPPGRPYVALFEPGGRLEIGRVGSSTSTQLTLAAGVANAWNEIWTTVAPAMLARHTNQELVLDYSRNGEGWFAEVKLSWREVAPEYAPPAGETRGVTLGRLPASAWFYKIELDYNGIVLATYLTNWESGAVIDGHAWTYNVCGHDKLVRSDDLEDDGGTFTMRWYAGCPFENWQPGQLAARGYVTIYRADADPAGNLSNFSTLIKGELVKPTVDGINAKAKIAGANALFARMGPRQMMSPACGTNLFKPRCGLLLANWTFNATVVSVAGNVVVIGGITRANGSALPAGFAAANWFALGWLGWTVGGAPMRDSVMSNVAIAGGNVSLTLARAIAIGVGTAVSVVPGCDRTGATCRDKFSNHLRFRGFEFMPSVSPSLVIPTMKATSAKK